MYHHHNPSCEQHLSNSNDPDASVTVADLEAWEVAYGAIPDGAVVVMRSGRGASYGDWPRYLGGDPAVPDDWHFPGFHADAARWLVDNRKIHGVGVDTPSLDVGSSRDFDAHQIFTAANVWGVENLANVDLLPPTGRTIEPEDSKAKSCRFLRFHNLRDGVQVEAGLRRPGPRLCRGFLGRQQQRQGESVRAVCRYLVHAPHAQMSACI